jgi:DNA-binding NarL/FixJ family response regulator
MTSSTAAAEIRHTSELHAGVPRPLDALSSRETRVLELVARGASGKEVAFTLGVAESTVSASLRDVAIRVGVTSSTTLAVIAASLIAERPRVSPATFTEAERAVLALLREGRSNADIAARRGTTERTIANQVASMLRKSRAPSRRALAALTTP